MKTRTSAAFHDPPDALRFKVKRTDIKRFFLPRPDSSSLHNKFYNAKKQHSGKSAGGENPVALRGDVRIHDSSGRIKNGERSGLSWVRFYPLPWGALQRLALHLQHRASLDGTNISMTGSMRVVVEVVKEAWDWIVFSE